MRIAVLLANFPSVSQTFILRQITGLLDLGHEVDIYAQGCGGETNSVHPEVRKYDLLARTVYTDATMPRAAGYWEMPVWPITGRTRLPDSDEGVLNAVRLLQAIPAFMRACRAAPRLAFEVIDPREYGHEASSLSALYRLSILGRRSGRYDVVHAHFGPIANTFRFARRLWNAPLVVSFHGYDFSTWPRRQGAGVYRRLFPCTDIVTVNSDYARERVQALGCPSRAIRKLPYALTLTDFPFQPRSLRRGERVRILTVARLVAKKGIEHSVSAVAALRRTYPDVQYDIIGDGPLRPSIEELIRRTGVEDCVTLHGARDGDYVKQMMKQAHLFVLASVTAANGDQEGTPVSLLEAQASGLPVVSTLHSGIPEVVADRESGFLVPEGDVAALTERLAELAAHPERWATMGLRGRRRIEEVHDIHKVNRELTGVYRDAILQYRNRLEAPQ